MTKSDLIDIVAKKVGTTRERATLIVNAVFDGMIEAMKRGDRIEIRNFGNFVIKSYSGYEGRNPKTGEKVKVRPKKMPFFKAGLGIKKMLNSSQ